MRGLVERSEHFLKAEGGGKAAALQGRSGQQRCGEGLGVVARTGGGVVSWRGKEGKGSQASPRLHVR